MDQHALDRLEFWRVTAAMASHAESDAGHAAVSVLRPLADRSARERECTLLGEALRRTRDPGEWVWTGDGRLSERLEPEHPGGPNDVLAGPGLVLVRGWLEAAEQTRAEWSDSDRAAGFPALAEQASFLPALDRLLASLRKALEPDGRVSDRASDVLARARRGVAEGERKLLERLERWVRPFGAGAYATRHGDRFVAMVPAAGFPRRRGIVHDVSGSGQSLLVEPLESCDENNRLIELRATAEAEERRILVELAAEVRDSAEELLATEARLAHLDGLRARARWAAGHGGVVVVPGGERLALRRARHPVLAMGPAADRLVPLDLTLDRQRRVLLVSGPNMGGKTVLLKTVGLTVVLAHAACPVLAGEGTTFPEVNRVMADIGDEQSLDRGLSTFAAHLGVLGEMTASAGPDALLLCDELGAGTDPEEGTALARALIERFAERGAWAIVTSHLGGLKTLAEEVSGVVNGSLGFDRERMSPRYTFLADVPGASHALAMAERLGFDPAVIERARALAPASAAATEALIDELQRGRDRADAARVALEGARVEADGAAAAHREATEEARREARELRRRLTHDSEALIAQARELYRRLERDARRAGRVGESRPTVAEEIHALEGDRTRLDDELARAGGGEPEPAVVLGASDVLPGTRLRVMDLGVEAEVVSGPDAEGNVTLQRGAWRITSRLDRLARSATQHTAEGARGAPTPAVAYEGPEHSPLEVDLRGMDVDEALRALDQSLDRGILAGLGEIRIIHGVGKGVLRAAVERHLRDHPQVAGQRLGVVGEGGRGVTIARLT